MAVLSRDRVIGEAEVRATLGAAVQDAASADIGIEAAVGALVDRPARAAPAALTTGTLYDRAIAAVERPPIRPRLAPHAQHQPNTGQRRVRKERIQTGQFRGRA